MPNEKEPKEQPAEPVLASPLSSGSSSQTPLPRGEEFDQDYYYHLLKSDQLTGRDDALMYGAHYGVYGKLSGAFARHDDRATDCGYTL